MIYLVILGSNSDTDFAGVNVGGVVPLVGVQDNCKENDASFTTVSMKLFSLESGSH